MSEEAWRQVVGFDGLFAHLYEVSNRGRIRRRVAGSSYAAGRVKQPQRGPTGYPVVMLSAGPLVPARMVKLHRAVAEAFIGPMPSGYEVNHKDGDKWNADASNLEYITPKENRDHAVASGLTPGGTRHYRAKLTVAQIAEIRRRYSAGELMKDIAPHFGVAPSRIGHVVRGLSYKREIAALSESVSDKSQVA
jgi:hypothetical protein